MRLLFRKTALEASLPAVVAATLTLRLLNCRAEEARVLQRQSGGTAGSAGRHDGVQRAEPEESQGGSAGRGTGTHAPSSGTPRCGARVPLLVHEPPIKINIKIMKVRPSWILD